MFKLLSRVRINPRFLLRLRISLKIQIALLGILGVLFTGFICLAGLYLDAQAQAESDQVVNLRQHVVGLSANYLEAGQIANEFLRRHVETGRPARQRRRDSVGASVRN
jgi:methyl-accepting chemotaxis protein